MRVFLALVLAAALPAAAQAPSPVTPGAQPPPAAPERPPDVTQAPPKPDLTPKPAAKPEEASRPDVRTVAGEIGGVAWSEQQFTLEAADGPLAVHVDRNTLVFLESRLGTVRDLHAGLPVRAGLEGPRNLATWVEVRPQGTAPGSGKPEALGAAVGTPGGAAAGGSGSPGRQPPTPSPIPPSTTPPGTPPGPGPVPGGTGR